MAKFCVNCGAPLTEGAAFCVKCGATVPEAAAEPAAQPKFVQPQPVQQPQPQFVPQQQFVQPQFAAAPAPVKAKKSGGFIKGLNVFLALAALALIIVGAITIPGKLKVEKLPPVAFTDVEPDGETAADYETLAGGGTLLGVQADPDWAASVTHETPEWYFADEDE